MKLVIAASAWASLDALQKYWAQFNSDDVVLARIDELLAEAVWLRDWPGAGAQEIYMVHRGRNYRKWTVGGVKIIFYIHENELRISDFFAAKRHPGRMKG